MFKRARLDLVIKINHNHGRLVVVVGNEFSHDNTEMLVALF